jgi:hypothetical protein
MDLNKRQLAEASEVLRALDAAVDAVTDAWRKKHFPTE